MNKIKTSPIYQNLNDELFSWATSRWVFFFFACSQLTQNLNSSKIIISSYLPIYKLTAMSSKLTPRLIIGVRIRSEQRHWGKCCSWLQEKKKTLYTCTYSNLNSPKRTHSQTSCLGALTVPSPFTRNSQCVPSYSTWKTTHTVLCLFQFSLYSKKREKKKKVWLTTVAPDSQYCANCCMPSEGQ